MCVRVSTGAHGQQIGKNRQVDQSERDAADLEMKYRVQQKTLVVFSG